MKKNLLRTILGSLKKIKQQKLHIGKFRFSTFKEDFVITEQEEREGGFFGSLNFKPAV